MNETVAPLDFPVSREQFCQLFYIPESENKGMKVGAQKYDGICGHEKLLISCCQEMRKRVVLDMQINVA